MCVTCCQSNAIRYQQVIAEPLLGRASFLQQRFDCVRPDVIDVPCKGDHALLIDEKCLRDDGNTILIFCRPCDGINLSQSHELRIPVLGEVLPFPLESPIDRDCNDNQSAICKFLSQRFKMRHSSLACRTGARPEFNQHHVSKEIGELNNLTSLIQQRECRRPLSLPNADGNIVGNDNVGGGNLPPRLLAGLAAK